MRLALIVCCGLIGLGLVSGEQRVLRRVAKSAPNSERFASFGKRSVSNAAAAAASGESAKQATAEVEPLSSAPSSWQVMSAIEAPAANGRSDLSAASSDDSSSSAYSQNEGDFLRSPSKTSRQQATPFYQPQKQRPAAPSKTSNLQASKTNWYQPPPSPPPSRRPAPIVQERFEQQQQQQQQNEQYVEQQPVESAPPGQAEPFAFDFNTRDQSGNGQYRKEQSDNDGVVRGSYGFQDASGIYRHVEYVADQNGFRANIKSNEPGVEAGPKSQPASIRLEGGAPGESQRSTATSGNNENPDWSAATSSTDERANLALAPPDFESSHKPERIRSPRQF